MTWSVNGLLAFLATIFFIIAAIVIAPDWDAALFWLSVGSACFAAAHLPIP